MKIREMRELTPAELEGKITEKAEELANLKFQKSLHQLDNTVKVRHIHRELARMKTILKEHQLGVRSLAGAGTPTAAETA